MATAHLASQRLRLWAALSSDAAGVDPGLRAARKAHTWGGPGEVAAGQRTDAGPTARTVTGSRGWTVTDAAGDIVAPADPHSGELVGGRQGRLAGSRYGGAVWRQRGWRICVDG